jgi:hypothetical protein
MPKEDIIRASKWKLKRQITAVNRGIGELDEVLGKCGKC